MDPSVPTGPAPDPSASRIKGTGVDALRADDASSPERTSRVKRSGLGGAMLGGTDLEVVPLGGPESRVTMTRRSKLTTEAGETVATETEEPVSRIRTNMSLRSAVVEAMTESVIPKTPEELIGETLLGLAQTHGFAEVLGGNLNLSGGYHLKPLVRREHPYEGRKHTPIPMRNGFSAGYETGADIGKLIETAPFERFKFYLSLDLSTPEKNAEAQVFMKEVYERAAQQQLSMLTKVEDHNYDSCNIYTWSPAEFTQILAELHAKYPNIWLNVEHPLQGQVGDVDPKHIGVVQEPILGTDNGSHSSRMHELGRVIDEHDGPLDAETWQRACDAAGVQPDAPWLIKHSLKRGYLKHLRALNI